MSKTRWIIIFLFALITAVCVTIFAGCKKNAEQTMFRLTYMADPGGQISGLTVQDVEGNKDGEVVIAIADEGFNFVKWSDGVMTAERQEQNVKEDKTYTAYFEAIKAEPVYYTLKYTAGTGGRIEGETEQTVLENESGTKVTAIADEGYKFVKWTDGNFEPTRAESTVTTNITVTAQFEKLTYRLTYNAAEGGYLVGECNQTVNYGESGSKVTAVPNEGFKFVKWSDGIATAERQDCVGTNSKTLTAYFSQVPVYKLIYKTNSEYGIIEGESTQLILKGESGTTVTAIATHDDWVFIGWSDGVETPSRTDLAINANKNIEAYFRHEFFTYQYSASSNGGKIEGEISQRVKRDEFGTAVTAVPNEGYVFTSWSDGNKNPTRRDTVNKDLYVIAWFTLEFKVTYKVNNGTGGRIEGESEQTVFHHKDSKPVKAIADEGWVFVGWSDGVLENERYEKDMTYGQENFTMTAYFESEEKVFHYNYRGATSDASVKNVTVARNNPQLSKFVVPQKNGYEFVGWYADTDYKTRVTDEDGNLMYGYNTVTLETDTLYARWADPDDETGVFKILLVVVEEIDATLKLREDYTQLKRVQYKLTMSERILCKQIAGRMSAYLNSWFKETVKFEIDTYFTMQIVDTEDFYVDNDFLDPYRMKEVSHMYEKYDSLLTLFDMNDYNNEFIEPGVDGLGTFKKGCVYLDKNLMSQLKNPSIADKVLQGDEAVENRWDFTIDTCLHEFTHTVEFRYKPGELYDFDVAIIDLYYSGIHNYIEITRRYLLCEADVNGTRVGIPPTFWTDKLWESANLTINGKP